MKEFSNTEALVEASLKSNLEFLGELFSGLSKQEKKKTTKIEKEMIEAHQLYYSAIKKGYVIDTVGIYKTETR